MHIEFFVKDTGKALSRVDTNGIYFVMSDVVYQDNCETFESQQSVIGFDDCIKRAIGIGWRVIS